MNICPNCSTETSNPKFCSRSCAAQITNKIPKRKLTKKCKQCENLIPYDYINCKDHIRYMEDITLAECIYTKHHKSSAFALVRSRAKLVVKMLPKKCVSCGYDKHTEVCHIKSISSYPHDTLLSEINNIDNLIILCPNCHWEFDNRNLLLYPLS